MPRFTREHEKLTVTDVGAWLFKGNPRAWNIIGALDNAKIVNNWRAL